MSTAHYICNILAGNGLRPLFQPIVSAATREIWGFEGLIRGLDPRTSAIILPEELFDKSVSEGMAATLDAACRSVLLREYGKRYRRSRESCLFVNIHPATVLEGIPPEHLLDEVRAHGLQPGGIVVEIDRSTVTDSARLQQFVTAYRQAGFRVAFDDFGVSGCSLERISLMRPDFVKIDISVVRDIHRMPALQETFQQMARVTADSGGIAIAEGVETEEEAREISLLGGNLIQGYYFSRPMELYTIDRRTERRISSRCRQMGAVNPPVDKTSLLVCPDCKSRLSSVPEQRGAGYIESGSLHCAGCQSIFPIIRGIPVMLSPEKPYPGL